MRKETEQLKNSCQDEWQRIRAYSQRISSITNQDHTTNNPTTLTEISTSGKQQQHNISLLVEEWANIEQTKKETIELRDQAQQLLKYAEETVAAVETATVSSAYFNN